MDIMDTRSEPEQPGNYSISPANYSVDQNFNFANAAANYSTDFVPLNAYAPANYSTDFVPPSVVTPSTAPPLQLSSLEKNLESLGCKLVTILQSGVTGSAYLYNSMSSSSDLIRQVQKKTNGAFVLKELNPELVGLTFDELLS